MSIRANYTSIINYVSLRTSTSTYRTRNIITTLGKCIKEAVKSGKDIDIENLFQIKYKASKLPKIMIYQNTIYDISDQIQEVCKITDYPLSTVDKVIRTYFRHINDLVGDGYKVTVKGVGALIPEKLDENSNNLYTNVTISPVLNECKPEKNVYPCINTDGEKNNIEIKKENLRFELVLSKNLNQPIRQINQKIKLEFVDI